MLLIFYQICFIPTRCFDSQVYKSPLILFFWVSSKRLEFLTEFSDRLEKESANSDLVLALERGANVAINRRWEKRLDSELLDEIGKYRKYDVLSVRDLLRLIRNKKHHYYELPQPVRSMVGTLPHGFYQYFESRFPSLLLHCYHIVKKHLIHERLFAIFLNDVARDNSASTDSPIPVVEANLPALATNTAAEVAQSSAVDDVIVWKGSSLQASLASRGWWREKSDWASIGTISSSEKLSKKNRASHLTKAMADVKYRTKFCSHWESTDGLSCPMRKKGKCVFAHGPIELRLKDSRRSKWGCGAKACSEAEQNRLSGGEDAISSARYFDPRAIESNHVEYLQTNNIGAIYTYYPPYVSHNFPANYNGIDDSFEYHLNP